MENEITAYKLVRKLKDGKYYPLFIDKTTPFQFGKWVKAECHKTKGFAVRTGYHCTFQCVANHLNEVLANGEHRTWIRCKVKNYTTYSRPIFQGGEWLLAKDFMALEEVSWEEVREQQKVWNERYGIQ